MAAEEKSTFRRTDQGEKFNVVLAGELPDSLSGALDELRNFTLIHCRGGAIEAAMFARRLSPCLLVCHEEFIRTIDPNQALELVGPDNLVELLLVSDGDQEALYGLFQNFRCSGFLQSGADAAALRRAIDAIRNGELWMPRRLLSRIVRELSSQRSKRLTPREKRSFT